MRSGLLRLARRLLAAFGSCTSEPGFLAGADFNGNGCIELTDLSILLSAFGSQCP